MAERKSKTPKPVALVITEEMRRLNEELHRRRAENAPLERRKSIAPPIGETQEVSSIEATISCMRKKADAHRARYLPHIKKLSATGECPMHDGEETRLDIEETLLASYAPDQLTPVYNGCELCIQEALVNEKCRKWIAMGVPKKTAHATFENYITNGQEGKVDALKKTKKQVARRKGFLILFGKYGCGKTHLASAAFKELGGGIFVTLGQLIDELRGTYDDGGKEKLVKKYQLTPNLVLDEVEKLGKSNGVDIQSADIQPFLYRVLAYRFDRDKFTVLTSNEDLTTILAILGPRLEDRMAQNYSSAPFTWESYRRQHRAA